MAFEVVKAMQADGLDWGEGYRPLGRRALAEIIEDQMAAAQPLGTTNHSTTSVGLRATGRDTS
jgi:hypothetical protein